MCSLRGYPKERDEMKVGQDFFGWFLTRDGGNIVPKSMRFIFNGDNSSIVFYEDEENGNIKRMSKSKIKAWKPISPPVLPPNFLMEEVCRKNTAA